MKKTQVQLALTIDQPGEQFANEDNMLRWITACLNCNVNHAQVQVEKIPDPAASALAMQKIDSAFQKVNSLLDASGSLESEPLQKAMYQLRLEIASATGNQDRVAAATASLAELSADAPDQAGLADQAYASYDFGPNLVVTDSSGWEYTSPGHERTRKVYVEKVTGLETEGGSWQLSFTVVFDPITGQVREAYALDRNGNRVGKQAD